MSSQICLSCGNQRDVLNKNNECYLCENSCPCCSDYLEPNDNNLYECSTDELILFKCSLCLQMNTEDEAITCIICKNDFCEECIHFEENEISDTYKCLNCHNK